MRRLLFEASAYLDMCLFKNKLGSIHFIYIAYGVGGKTFLIFSKKYKKLLVGYCGDVCGK